MAGSGSVQAPNDPQNAYKLQSEANGITVAKSVYSYLKG
jgi:LDH2 family malate/lactate/ureidoglycolate dehydrogenase